MGESLEDEWGGLEGEWGGLEVEWGGLEGEWGGLDIASSESMKSQCPPHGGSLGVEGQLSTPLSSRQDRDVPTVLWPDRVEEGEESAPAPAPAPSPAPAPFPSPAPCPLFHVGRL